MQIQNFIEYVCFSYLLYRWSLGNQTRCADLLLIISKLSTTKWAYTDGSSLTYSITRHRTERGVSSRTRRQTLLVLFCFWSPDTTCFSTRSQRQAQERRIAELSEPQPWTNWALLTLLLPSIANKLTKKEDTYSHEINGVSTTSNLYGSSRMCKY